jgi:hypothetical protein
MTTWKLHQRALPPCEQFTVCGLPTTGGATRRAGRADPEPIVVPSLQGNENDCRNCVRLLAKAKLEPATKTRKEGPPK